MTTYYLSSVDGNDGSDGLSWDNAFLTFKYAVETVSAAASGPHLLYVDSAHSESLSADATITLAGDIRVACVNRSTGALATTAVIGAQATNYAITLAGGYVLYVYGIAFKNGTGSTNKNLVVSGADGNHYEFENCRFETSGSHNSDTIRFGTTTIGNTFYLKLTSCVFRFGSTKSFGMLLYRGLMDFDACSIDSSGTAPISVLTPYYCDARFSGCDLSKLGSGTLVNDGASLGTSTVVFSNCKFGDGQTTRGSAGTVLNKGQASVWAFNCDAGDNHYAMYHADPFGETSVSATVYANDGAAYDGTNKCSWKIVTTANCSYYTPYVSPWIDKYHAGTSAITPRLEILRDGSATAYQNDEVWAEFSYQGTSGSTQGTIVSDRMTPLGSAADQTTGGLDASGWTGENATAWFGKLTPTATITPAEIGHLRARVCVGEPSITVYVDPQIRDDGTAGSGQSRVTPSGWIDTVASSGASPRFGDRTGGLR